MSEDDAFHSYQPGEGHRLRHDPFNAIVAPRPIGWISSIAADGTRNLAPYSFFNAFNYHPPLIGFASVGDKDTLGNVRASREFVWNLATRDLADPMNASSAEVGAGIDEFDLAGLAAAPSTLIGAPRVAAASVSFECRLADIHRLRDAAGAQIDSWLVIGEVVMVHIRRDLVAGGTYDTPAARPILRGGGPSAYYEVDGAGRFDMRRPS